MIARPAEHPFYSYDDWFIGSTACDFGIPKEIKQFTVTYKQDSIEDLERLFNEYPGQIACVISEPEKWNVLEPDFYQKAIDLAHKNGALWIMDEMITGFRWDFRGAQNYYGITPDLSTFGKAMANGFAVAALTGKKEIMSLLMHVPDDSVLIGIDELTAIVKRSGSDFWQVYGQAKLHMLKGSPEAQFSHGQEIRF